jgi:glycosyltransferase involved in cell wall biosynthesis
MLANGRPEMVARAVQSFRAQTYGNKHLRICENHGEDPIGTLRNAANETSKGDIIVHWDSDDWSHPNRIAEQVALLQSIGAECVGYNEMLFWHETWNPMSESWLYRTAIPNYAVGTSMCYWRETWVQHPFSDRSEGCDDLEWFNKGVRIVSASSLRPYLQHLDPMMIASIHGGNTCAKIAAGAREWTRVPNWDKYCRDAMQL